MSELQSVPISHDLRPSVVKERIRSLGLDLREISSEDIDSVTDRDLLGEFYGYVSTLDKKFDRGIARMGLFAGPNIVGYYISGRYDRDGILCGEIGIMHVSPCVRGLGLGSLLLCAAVEDLAETSRVIHAIVGDETGKVEHLLEGLGFKEDEGDDEYPELSSFVFLRKQPFWKKDLSLEKDKSDFNLLLEERAQKTIQALSSKQALLLSRAKEVDIDNPNKVDVVEAVSKRIKDIDFLSPENFLHHLNIFGYRGAEIRLARSYLIPQQGYSMSLDLRGVDPRTAAEVLRKLDNGKEYSIGPLYLSEEQPDEGVSIWSRNTYKAEELKKRALELAGVAKTLYRQEVWVI